MLLRTVLQGSLQPVLEEFSRGIAHLAGVQIQTGSTFNDSFLLRSYVRGERSDGSEVAVTVDVKMEDGVLNVESDICRTTVTYTGKVLHLGWLPRMSSEPLPYSMGGLWNCTIT